MPVAYEVPRILVLSIPGPAIDADLIVVPIAEEHAAAVAEEFDAAVGGSLGVALARGEFAPRPCDAFTAPITAGGWSANRMVFMGGGPRADIGPERLRRMAAAS